ncbi:MAG: hypothetical protein PHS17_10135, partial [Desulfobacterales bacterium]|nr:hypothetical protein [Desulfobacterales bacterium]
RDLGRHKVAKKINSPDRSDPSSLPKMHLPFGYAKRSVILRTEDLRAGIQKLPLAAGKCPFS